MRKIAFILTYIIVSVSIITGQSTLCPIDYSDALNQTETVCDGTARNQACYGNNTVNLVPFVETTSIEFNSPGDVTDVDAIRSLSLSALDESTGEWGIAMLRLLANLDPTQTDDVTVLLFGDVEIESTANHLNVLPVTTATYANLRRYPNTTATVMASVAQNATLTATGRLEDSSWIQVVDDETNIGGWVFADLLNDFDATSLEVVASSQPYFGPMQAFYYTSESHDSGCTAVPSDGLFIQTPEGVGRVTIWINEVTIDFVSDVGSTAYIEAPTDDAMTIDMLEGGAYVESETGGYVAIAGSSVSVTPANGNRPTTVNPPQPSTMWGEDESPNGLLGHEINPAEPATMTDIAEANGLSQTQYEEVVTYGYVLTQDNTDASSSNGDAITGTDTTGSNNTDSNSPVDSVDECPGNSCNSSGNNNNPDDCPGNSCNAPGQNKDKDKDKDKKDKDKDK